MVFQQQQKLIVGRVKINPRLKYWWRKKTEIKTIKNKIDIVFFFVIFFYYCLFKINKIIRWQTLVAQLALCYNSARIN